MQLQEIVNNCEWWDKSWTMSKYTQHLQINGNCLYVSGIEPVRPESWRPMTADKLYLKRNMRGGNKSTKYFVARHHLLIPFGLVKASGIGCEENLLFPIVAKKRSSKSPNLSEIKPSNWLLSRSISCNVFTSKSSSGIGPVNSLRSLFERRREKGEELRIQILVV